MIEKKDLKDGEYYWIINKNQNGYEFLEVALCGYNGRYYMLICGSDMEEEEFEVVAHVPVVDHHLTNPGLRT